MHVLNLNTGDRAITYAISATAGSGAVVLHGPAARRGEIGDKIIVLSYCQCEDDEARKIKPAIVHVDDKNLLRSSTVVLKHKHKG